MFDGHSDRMGESGPDGFGRAARTGDRRAATAGTRSRRMSRLHQAEPRRAQSERLAGWRGRTTGLGPREIRQSEMREIRLSEMREIGGSGLWKRPLLGVNRSPRRRGWIKDRFAGNAPENTVPESEPEKRARKLSEPETRVRQRLAPPAGDGGHESGSGAFGPDTVSATQENCTSAFSGIKRCGGSLLSMSAMGRRHSPRAVKLRVRKAAQGTDLASLEERTRPYRGVVVILAERDGARDCCDACCTCVIFDATRLPGVEVCSCYC